MSAHFFGDEVKKTKKYLLGEALGAAARHFLLMTATPHAGKEEDFQLFLALLDADRFEGRFRDGVHTIDPSNLMRRMVKEKLLTFEGKPLFPERRATTVDLRAVAGGDGAVRRGHRRTSASRWAGPTGSRTQGQGRRGNTVGFALTLLQRRLASSPEAIYQSLSRRRKRLEARVDRGAPDGPAPPRSASRPRSSGCRSVDGATTLATRTTGTTSRPTSARSSRSRSSTRRPRRRRSPSWKPRSRP